MLYYGQDERVEELNQRINERDLPDSRLQPNFDIQSTPTKYSRFPVTNLRRHMPNETPIQNSLQEDSILPVGGKALFSGFKIDSESRLQNRFFALQRNGSGMQNQYIPSTQSDLYNVTVESKPSEQPFPGLFKAYPKKVVTEVPDFVGFLQMSNKTFNNATRTQLRIDTTY
jgi:hypothetical protein